MKTYLIVIAIFGSLNASADNYNNIACQSASGSQQYYVSGQPLALSIGCNPSAMCATNSLQTVLATIPEFNNAAYSQFFDKYVEVTQKVVSKPTLETTVSRMNGSQCVSGEDVYGNDQVDCSQSTACAAISVSYAECTKITYDQQTGAKIVTCPSGKVIR